MEEGLAFKLIELHLLASSLKTAAQNFGYFTSIGNRVPCMTSSCVQGRSESCWLPDPRHAVRCSNRGERRSLVC
eukprot:6150878-Pleurochrysis_carterae.AAC.4